jgi:hypothetical protein
VLATSVALTASAQDGTIAQPAPAAVLPSNTEDALTGKERLGRKWMDEQRIDNCKVPIERRGTRLRSSTCPQVPMG